MSLLDGLLGSRTRRHYTRVACLQPVLGFYLRGDGGGAAVSTGQGRLRLLKLVIDSSGRDR